MRALEVFFENPPKSLTDAQIEDVQRDLGQWLSEDPHQAYQFYQKKIKEWQREDPIPGDAVRMFVVQCYEKSIKEIFAGQPPMGMLPLCKAYHANQEWMAALLNWLLCPENKLSVDDIINSGLLHQVFSAVGQTTIHLFYNMLDKLKYTASIRDNAEQVVTTSSPPGLFTLTGDFFYSTRPEIKTTPPVLTLNAHDPLSFYLYFGEDYLTELFRPARPDFDRDHLLKTLFAEDNEKLRSLLTFLKHTASLNLPEEVRQRIYTDISRLTSVERMEYIAKQPESWPIFYLAPYRDSKEDVLHKRNDEHLDSLTAPIKEEEKEKEVLERLLFLKTLLTCRSWQQEHLILHTWFQAFLDLMFTHGKHREYSWKQHLKYIISLYPHLRPNMVLHLNNLPSRLQDIIQQETTKRLSRPTYNRLEDGFSDLSNQYHVLLNIYDESMTESSPTPTTPQYAIKPFAEYALFHALILKSLSTKIPVTNIPFDDLSALFKLSLEDPYQFRTLETLRAGLALNETPEIIEKIISLLNHFGEEWKTKAVLERAIDYDNVRLIDGWLLPILINNIPSAIERALSAQAMSVIFLILDISPIRRTDVLCKACEGGFIELGKKIQASTHWDQIPPEGMKKAFRSVCLSAPEEKLTELFALFSPQSIDSPFIITVLKDLITQRKKERVTRLLEIPSLFQSLFIETSLIAATKTKSIVCLSVPLMAGRLTQAEIDAALMNAVDHNHLEMVEQILPIKPSAPCIAKALMKPIISLAASNKLISKASPEELAQLLPLILPADAAIIDSFIKQANGRLPTTSLCECILNSNGILLDKLLTLKELTSDILDEVFIMAALKGKPEILYRLAAGTTTCQISQRALRIGMSVGSYTTILMTMNFPEALGPTKDTLIQVAAKCNPAAGCGLLTLASEQLQPELQKSLQTRFPHNEYFKRISEYKAICKTSPITLGQAKCLLQAAKSKEPSLFDPHSKALDLAGNIITKIDRGEIQNLEQFMQHCHENRSLSFFLNQSQMLSEAPLSNALFFILFSCLKPCLEQKRTQVCTI